MASGDQDQSLLGPIDKLVKEAEQLYGVGQLTESEQERLSIPES
jgi:hypothetical protein